MSYYDNHVMMSLKLGRWSQEHSLRAYEIEREIMAARQKTPVKSKIRIKRFSLGNLKSLWGSTA
ncbi:hypothetical protein [uncultured Ruegeria sp.]|jgi:hypothetical protein|uniref:hypothetical protein n=1 Tax=uncultured Ruegeria sp. TaxID=259304 RepID=UPI00263189A5|nr:hypothetical protein [uncultured Ruegeria sp.]